MTAARDRLLAALNHERPDRLPLIDLTFWPETLERWRGEGLPRDAEPETFFGLDRLVCINDLFDPSFGLPEQTLEETAEHRVYRDRYGKTMKEWRSATSPPSILEAALRTPDEWAALKPRLAAGPERFNNPAAEAQYAAASAAGEFLAITPAEPLWFVLELTMGFEHGLAAVIRHKALVADMVATYTDYLLAMLEQTLARGYRFDALWFWSDLCYRNGLLLSPRTVRELVLPHWRRLSAWVHDHGMKLMFHCDGDVGQLLPLLLEAGLDAIHPLEVRAGNDARVYKQQYGERLCLIGNIDADVIATNDRAAIEAEVAAKVPALAAGGGYIYHIDHSVPPTIALDSYRFLLECVRRYGG
jgi:uroporphyrinogen decarboxylase